LQPAFARRRRIVPLIGAQAEFASLNDDLAHLRLAEASAAVLALADAVQADYERRKRAEAALDYDDLIVKTQNLLSRADAAAWVLYKIDGGIDHILVDEAQDTNPAQWSIIEALAAEFFSGSGASDKLRTLFAVGDEKQSIYSFQGANPARFGEVGRAFRQRAAALGLTWHEVPLNLSFRSAEPILQAVDSVFARACREGLTWQAGGHPAPCVPDGEAGLVELGRLRPRRSPFRPSLRALEREPAGARSVMRSASASRRDQGWLDRRAASQGRASGSRHSHPRAPPRPLHHADDPPN
jgi:ATP-dependent helicase/nuclease subunit A